MAEISVAREGRTSPLNAVGSARYSELVQRARNRGYAQTTIDGLDVRVTLREGFFVNRPNYYEVSVSRNGRNYEYTETRRPTGLTENFVAEAVRKDKK
jgi:hypothetical protein